jgi:predicted amidohydrolase
MNIPLRIAVRQPPMHWSIAEHVADVARSLGQASSLGAELAAFPELTLTGLHTKVPSLLDPAAIHEAMDSVAAACSQQQIWAAVGAPVFGGGVRPFDAYVVITAEGKVAMTSAKMRLMPPGEPMIFDAGTDRPSVDVKGTSVAAVICREMLDHDDLARELAHRANVILWPGVMARGPYDPSNPDDYAGCAVRVAMEQDAWIVHSNWATNVQAPGIPNTGKSMAIAPSGDIVLEAPARKAGLLLSWKSSLDEAWVED